MECNIGEQDRKYRLAGGVALLCGSIVSASIVLALIGAALLLSGWKRHCMIYKLFGYSTNKDGDNKPPAPPAA